MVTIVLPPELEKAVAEEAAQKGTTVELLTLDVLQERFLPELPSANKEPEGETMADFFAGYAGMVNSREIVPEGAHLSHDTGRKFKELMLQKYRSGKL